MNSVLINMNVIQCLLLKVSSGQTDGEHPLNHKIKILSAKVLESWRAKRPQRWPVEWEGLKVSSQPG